MFVRTQTPTVTIVILSIKYVRNTDQRPSQNVHVTLQKTVDTVQLAPGT